jgi:hypothetical protein
MRKLRLIIFLLLLIICLNSCSETTKVVKEIEIARGINIVNNTGATITSVFVRNPGTSSWGNNLITQNIPSGSTISIIIPTSSMNSNFRSDIQLRSAENVYYTRTLLNIAQNGTIAFASGDFDTNTPDRQITLRNNTGETITSAVVSMPGTSAWSGNLLSQNMPPDDSRGVTFAAIFMDNNIRSDIQLRTAENIYYIRTSQLITHNGTIPFTSDDFDLNSPARRITLQNNTGATITSVFARVPSSTAWNLITQNDITNIVIPRTSMNNDFRSDIRIRTAENIYYIRASQLIIHNGPITFSSDDFDLNSPLRQITLENNTGEAITSVFARVAVTGGIWGNNLITQNISSGGQQTVTIPTSLMDSSFQSDIQLRTAENVYYTRTSQTIVHNGPITFGAGDFDSNSLARRITLQNNTGDTIISAFARVAVTGGIWGNNLITQNISSGGQQTVTIPTSSMGSFMSDIQLRSAENIYYIRTLHHITHNGQITFASDDFDLNSPARRITLQNNTGATITSAFARIPETSIWGDNLITQSISSGVSRSVTIPTSSMNGSFRSDIQLRTATNLTFTKEMQIVTQGIGITFSNTDHDLEIGPAGGIVFYDKGFYSDGWRFMEAAPASSEFNAIWGSTSVYVTGTQKGIGTGRTNTNLIVAMQGGPNAAGTAAQRCAALNINGYTDWFLPSSDELDLMYQILHRIGLGEFQNTWYWSSSQSNTARAWR